MPFFGICLGMQTAVIEFARNVCGLEGANSTEFDEEPQHKVIYKLRDLIGVEALGGTMRLGKYPCELSPRAPSPRAPTATSPIERAAPPPLRGQPGVPAARSKEAGLTFTGHVARREVRRDHRAPDDHPWFLGCQFHPGVQVQAVRLHPLFKDFIRAAARSPGGHAGKSPKPRNASRRRAEPS